MIFKPKRISDRPDFSMFGLKSIWQPCKIQSLFSPRFTSEPANKAHWYFSNITQYIVTKYTLRKRVLWWFFIVIEDSTWLLLQSKPGYGFSKPNSVVKNLKGFFIFMWRTLRGSSSIHLWRTLCGGSYRYFLVSSPMKKL